MGLVGAKDYIDRLLAQQYSDKQTNKFDADAPTLVNPNEMLRAMNDYADMQRTMLALNIKLKSVCNAVNTKSATYPGVRVNNEEQVAC